MKKPLILLGGADIHPKYYDEKPHPKAGPFNLARDAEEFLAVEKAVETGTPVIGICRGAQLLCVYNGGSLWQHSEGHRNNAHSIKTDDGDKFTSVSADHHQIMIPFGGYTLFGWDDRPTTVYKNSQEFVLSITPEIVWWPEHNHLAIQPHPEWEPMGSKFNEWIDELLQDLGIDYSFSKRN